MNDIGVATIDVVSDAATDPRSLRRFEDERFLTGRGQYQDDEHVPGALHAGLGDLLFWASLAFSLVVAFVVTVPVNRAMLARGKGHAVAHAYHH